MRKINYFVPAILGVLFLCAGLWGYAIDTGYAAESIGGSVTSTDPTEAKAVFDFVDKDLKSKYIEGQFQVYIDYLNMNDYTGAVLCRIENNVMTCYTNKNTPDISVETEKVFSDSPVIPPPPASTTQTPAPSATASPGTCASDDGCPAGGCKTFDGPAREITGLGGLGQLFSDRDALVKEMAAWKASNTACAGSLACTQQITSQETSVTLTWKKVKPNACPQTGKCKSFSASSSAQDTSCEAANKKCSDDLKKKYDAQVLGSNDICPTKCSYTVNINGGSMACAPVPAPTPSPTPSSSPSPSPSPSATASSSTGRVTATCSMSGNVCCGAEKDGGIFGPPPMIGQAHAKICWSCKKPAPTPSPSPSTSPSPSPSPTPTPTPTPSPSPAAIAK